MRFPENFIQEVAERTDIVELISRYVTLKRGGSNMLGLCPFHSEKTPSFTVSPAKKMFFCFGCHAGGSAITFVQKMENLDFVDAVEMLADRAGIPVPRDSAALAQQSGVSRKRVLEMNLEAAKFFRSCLFDPNIGAEGMRYFRDDRGLSGATIKHFGLGYAPNSFGMLTDHMHRLGYSDEELIEACLCGKSQKTGRAYDYFRNRVIFPIIDTSGNVIAFGGRVMDDSKPKYLNTSDTPAFKKSKNLFALNFAKNCCAEQMILCEGYMDVIALHAAGIEFAVATLGTAMTPEHARMFSRYTKKVIVSYDSDEAGQNAAGKAMRLLSEVGVDMRVLKLTGAKDPDEYIRKFGPDRFRKLLEQSRTGFEYKSETVLAKYDLTVGSEKIKASNALCGIVAEYWSSVEREVYIDMISKKLELPVDVLRNTVEQLRRREAKRIRAEESREAQASVKNFGDRVNPESAKDPRAASAEETVLGLLLLREEHRSDIKKGDPALTEADFVTEFNRRVFSAVMQMHDRDGGFCFELFGADFTPDEMGRIEKMLVTRQQLTENGRDILLSAVQTLRDAKHQEEMKNTDFATRLAFLREKKSKIHKGKADEQ